ncbi:MAG: hypothetical protein Fur0021_04320 [Candidatus Promineifilaceae bacterium]
MATEKWVKIDAHYCDIIEREAEIEELRRYPADVVPDTLGYQVVARKCTAAIECNLLGCQCQWAYTNPTVDRFHLPEP